MVGKEDGWNVVIRKSLSPVAVAATGFFVVVQQTGESERAEDDGDSTNAKVFGLSDR